MIGLKHVLPFPAGVLMIRQRSPIDVKLCRSSLLNKLFGEMRSIVSNVPGTTRDSIDALFERGGRTYRLVDTAGIRRKGKARLAGGFSALFPSARLCVWV